jgi:hypothetical protein
MKLVQNCIEWEALIFFLNIWILLPGSYELVTKVTGKHSKGMGGIQNSLILC